MDHTLDMIPRSYTILFNRIFVLSIQDSEEYVCSFNIEKGNHSQQLPGAMLVHRKKETNTLYTINSLNALIRYENDGNLDLNYTVDWANYRNSFLLTSKNNLKILKTKLYQIINL
jgi:hypothetical protein